MSENIEIPSVPKTDKTNWKDVLSEAICSAISKNPKRIYPAFDIFFRDIRGIHWDVDLDRAIFSCIFFEGPSKIAAEKALRRKFRWDPQQNLDLSKFDHVASMFLGAVTNWIVRIPDGSYRSLCIEHIPEMLAALTTAEREIIDIKTALLINGRAARKKIAEWTKVVAMGNESLNNEIVEVIEPEVPPIVSPNEPGPMLEPEEELTLVLTSEQTPITTPEVTFEVASEPEVPIINTTVPSESIPEPKREDPSAFQNYE